MKSLITNDEIVLIHNKYYTEPIVNLRSSTKEDEKCLSVGNFIFAHHPNDTCVSDCLKTGILFEKFLLSFVKQFVDPNKNVLDIGANIGVHSVVFSNYATNAKVYSFEPQPVVFEILNKNLRMNKCDNVEVFNFGASDYESSFFMNAQYESTDNHGAFRICDKDENTVGIHIQCKPLDSLHIENVGFIKIDVEGHEYQTLLGLKNTITKNKPIIMVEIHENSLNFKAVFDLIELYGYNSYYKTSHCDYIFIH
jgi:FkbM family methyltransferase